MKLSTCRRILMACGSMAFFGVLSTLMGEEINPGHMQVALGLAAVSMAVAVVVAFRFWRCPHCKASLGWKRDVPRRCPNCGEKLEED